MKPEIRPARIDEAADLTALCVRSKRSNGYDAAFMAACVDSLMVTPARLEQGNFWIAESGGELRGCAALTISVGGDSGEVGMFFIDPEWQGKGVGRALWATLRQHAEEAGVKRLHLDADPFAEAYYERLGFKTTGRVPSGAIPGRTLPYMEVILADLP